MKKYFSLEKYKKWCKTAGIPYIKRKNSNWAELCAGKEVINGTVEVNDCVFGISDTWVEWK